MGSPQAAFHQDKNQVNGPPAKPRPLHDEPSSLAPKPITLEDLALSKWLLADLLCKHLFESGVLDLAELAHRIALPGTIVDELLQFLRTEGRVELRSRRDNSPLLRYGLTERGRSAAADALQRDGYVGPAPVALDHYDRIVTRQSARNFPTTRQQIHQIFADTVLRPEILDRLGPAVHSGRAIFIHGQPGTGKSFIARRLKRTLGPSVLLPYAIAVGDNIIRYFDPSVHIPVADNEPAQVMQFSLGHDPRYVRCERPAVIAGGELTMDVLELGYDASKRLYIAPLQLKANCGLLVIDDLGRQRINPESLLNRWILPMEEQRDQLALSTGQHFSVPFDLTLVFSTNLSPSKLADEAFLRRIGYKVRFDEASPAEYSLIWGNVCRQFDIEFDTQLLDFVFEELYARQQLPLLPCHPRDLLQLALDFVTYNGSTGIDQAALRWAWQNYFLDT